MAASPEVCCRAVLAEIGVMRANITPAAYKGELEAGRAALSSGGRTASRIGAVATPGSERVVSGRSRAGGKGNWFLYRADVPLGVEKGDPCLYVQHSFQNQS
jgi:hypothetical protein